MAANRHASIAEVQTEWERLQTMFRRPAHTVSGGSGGSGGSKTAVRPQIQPQQHLQARPDPASLAYDVVDLTARAGPHGRGGDAEHPAHIYATVAEIDDSADPLLGSLHPHWVDYASAAVSAEEPLYAVPISPVGRSDGYTAFAPAATATDPDGSRDDWYAEPRATHQAPAAPHENENGGYTVLPASQVNQPPPPPPVLSTDNDDKALEWGDSRRRRADDEIAADVDELDLLLSSIDEAMARPAAAPQHAVLNVDVDDAGSGHEPVVLGHRKRSASTSRDLPSAARPQLQLGDASNGAEGRPRAKSVHSIGSKADTLPPATERWAMSAGRLSNEDEGVVYADIVDLSGLRHNPPSTASLLRSPSDELLLPVASSVRPELDDVIYAEALLIGPDTTLSPDYRNNPFSQAPQLTVVPPPPPPPARSRSGTAASTQSSASVHSPSSAKTPARHPSTASAASLSVSVTPALSPDEVAAESAAAVQYLASKPSSAATLLLRVKAVYLGASAVAAKTSGSAEDLGRVAVERASAALEAALGAPAAGARLLSLRAAMLHVHEAHITAIDCATGRVLVHAPMCDVTALARHPDKPSLLGFVVVRPGPQSMPPRFHFFDCPTDADGVHAALVAVFNPPPIGWFEPGSPPPTTTTLPAAPAVSPIIAFPPLSPGLMASLPRSSSTRIPRASAADSASPAASRADLASPSASPRAASLSQAGASPARGRGVAEQAAPAGSRESGSRSRSVTAATPQSPRQSPRQATAATTQTTAAIAHRGPRQIFEASELVEFLGSTPADEAQMTMSLRIVQAISKPTLATVSIAAHGFSVATVAATTAAGTRASEQPGRRQPPPGTIVYYAERICVFAAHPRHFAFLTTSVRPRADGSPVRICHWFREHCASIAPLVHAGLCFFGRKVAVQIADRDSGGETAV